MLTLNHCDYCKLLNKTCKKVRIEKLLDEEGRFSLTLRLAETDIEQASWQTMRRYTESFVGRINVTTKVKLIWSNEAIQFNVLKSQCGFIVEIYRPVEIKIKQSYVIGKFMNQTIFL